jgi:hypothetical protein
MIRTGVRNQVAAGWIFGIDIYDETTGGGFVYSEKSGRNPFPVTIPYDHNIAVSALAENTGDVPQWMQLTIELIDPEGIVRRIASADYYDVSPSTQLTSGKTDSILPDKPGMWIIHALLEAGGSIADEGQWEAIYIEETPPPPPPVEFSFPWWLVAIGAAVAVVARTRKILKKK